MINKKESLFFKMKVLIIVSFLLPLLAISYSSTLSADEDPCLVPDTRLTVIIYGCDTGVNNVVVDQNCTISDEIMKCAMSAQSHDEFVSCVTSLTNDLKKKGIITGKDREKIQSCAAKADFTCKECDYPEISGEPHRFSFETSTDELSVEIQKVYNYYTITPTPDLDLLELDRKRNEGIRYLRNNPETAEILLSEASQLDPLDIGPLMAIFHLLGYVNSDAGVNFLFNHVIQSTPEGCLSGDEMLCDDFDVIRSSALEAIGQIRATTGNELALEKMLDLVESEVAFIQIHSINLVYDKGGMSRWRAKRLMREQLPVCKQYLLHNP